MDGDYITRQEHKEFALRMESENSRLDDGDKRTNQRLILPGKPRKAGVPVYQLHYVGYRQKR